MTWNGSPRLPIGDNQIRVGVRVRKNLPWNWFSVRGISSASLNCIVTWVVDDVLLQEYYTQSRPIAGHRLSLTIIYTCHPPPEVAVSLISLSKIPIDKWLYALLIEAGLSQVHRSNRAKDGMQCRQPQAIHY